MHSIPIAAGVFVQVGQAVDGVSVYRVWCRNFLCHASPELEAGDTRVGGRQFLRLRFSLPATTRGADVCEGGRLPGPPRGRLCDVLGLVDSVVYQNTLRVRLTHRHKRLCLLVVMVVVVVQVCDPHTVPALHAYLDLVIFFTIVFISLIVLLIIISVQDFTIV
jgi:hypothetical protein